MAAPKSDIGILFRAELRGEMRGQKNATGICGDTRNAHLRGMLALSLPRPQSRRFGSAADAEALPKFEPGAVRELFIVPSIGGRDVTCSERPNIGRFKHFLQLLDVVNDALNIHALQSWSRRRGAVNGTAAVSG